MQMNIIGSIEGKMSHWTSTQIKANKNRPVKLSLRATEYQILQMIFSPTDYLEFEDALKAKSCQTINSCCQCVAILKFLQLVIDYCSLCDLVSEEPFQHWTLQVFPQLAAW